MYVVVNLTIHNLTFISTTFDVSVDGLHITSISILHEIYITKISTLGKIYIFIYFSYLTTSLLSDTTSTIIEQTTTPKIGTKFLSYIFYPF